VLIPVFARDVLHGGPRTYGFLLAAQGAGAVIGALMLASRSTEPRPLKQSLLGGLFCLAAAMLVFAISRSIVLSMVAQILVGAGQISYMATTNTLLQLTVSDELRGRVMSMYTMSFIGMAPLGSLEIGFIGEHVGPKQAVIIAGAIAIACAVYLTIRIATLSFATHREVCLGTETAT
jgi:predicted MFS family arabinose efflux permease